jgi:transposase
LRTFGLDVHKRFAEVAVIEDGEIRRIGRIENGELESFALTLGAEDHVVLESTALTWPIAELLGRHAGKVTVSNPMPTKAIASAKVKTDKVDAKVLAQLGAADFCPRCGRRMRSRGCCGAGSLIVRDWCASAPRCATRCTRSLIAT